MGAILCGIVVNVAFERLFGWTQAEVRTMFLSDGYKSFWRFVSIGAWDLCLDEHLREMLTGQGEHRGFITIRTKNGQKSKCMYHCQGGSDKDGENPGMFQSFVPIPLQDG